MRIDVTQVLRSPAGEPFLKSETETLTFREVAIEALGSQYADKDDPTKPEALSGAECVRRTALAVRICNEAVVTLTDDEAALLRDLVARRWRQPFLVGAALLVLEGACYDNGATRPEATA